MPQRGVGASIPRKEDDRFMRGRGQYVADIQLPGMWNAAFVRSPHAHARIKSIRPPQGYEDRFFTAADLTDIKTFHCSPNFPGFKHSDFQILSQAGGKVRFVGDPVAVVAAPTRAEAEDLVQAASIDYEVLKPVMVADQALKGSGPYVHDHWGDNVYIQTEKTVGEYDALVKQAKHKVTRDYVMHRQSPMPMEGRGLLASYDSRLDELTVYMSHQLPHPMQTGISQMLGIDHNRVRVICPDVGGGFGLKVYLEVETLVIVSLSRRLKRPIRWIQDRYEHLVGDSNTREHSYRFTMHADARGKVLAVDGEVIVNVGAYSTWPWPAGVEGEIAVGNFTGPYDTRAFKAKHISIATNKPPSGPFRGVTRPLNCYISEVTMDAVARAVGRTPEQVRFENLVKPEQMPYTAITKKHMDSGDYPETLRRALALVEVDKVRARQKAGEKDGRRVGLGIACFYEQTAYGTGPMGYAGWGIELVPGHEIATVKLTPDGGVWVSVGIHSHGQGLETTLAQVASEILTVDPDRIAIRYGDTATAYAGTGTYASRSMVVAGGAVAKSARLLIEPIKKIGAHLLQCDVGDVELKNGEVVGPRGSVPFAAVGRAFYLHPEELPPDFGAATLTATGGHLDKVHGGVFANAAHVAVVAVDPETGFVEVLDYGIVFDCGRMVNPQIVYGQVYGALAQGIGNALYEESEYDAHGNPTSVTLADYIIPGATEMPEVKIEHMESPSPYSEFGMKGIGENGCIGPPAAIANAISDAFRDIGVEVNETPATPRRVYAAIQQAKARSGR
jgi:carbon-monoxide dehydrogenase large subunit